MESLFLIKPGEILLKQGNQDEFIKGLIRQLRLRMGKTVCDIFEYPGRFFLSVDSANEAKAAFVLDHCPGLNGFAKAKCCAKTVEAVLAASMEVAKEGFASGSRSFKVETRRSDKSFPLGSYETSALMGEKILAALPELTVDVHSPDLIVNLEIREKAYAYGATQKGPRGLPSGSGGRALVLLSGGIDSPVAAFLMAVRGLELDFVHFQSYPYTSIEAQRKVEKLTRLVTAWCGRSRLWVLPFTEVQQEIKKRAAVDASTIMLRSAMMEAANRIAGKIGAKAIVTGESLGQVASQTAENMRITEAPTTLPVFRPLVGLDKEDIIHLAKRIGTYETSILPYEDCCVLFSPKHPLLKPDYGSLVASYRALALTPFIERSVEGTELFKYGYTDVLTEFGVR
ncbi:MAG: tRNA 4-thiouridine(8) synthase ThiI [Spirochaetes bacterium]|nr:tRNA 4-thiouridine(8) synthase ThiI [Spirochaetota bacterium]